MLRRSRCALCVSVRGNSTNDIPDNQEGGIAAANSTIGQKYQRAQMKHNAVTNLLMLFIVVAPLAVFAWYRSSKYFNIWGSWSDPYALPAGFDPNKDPAPVRSTKMAEPRRPMMTSVAPGGFSVLPEKDAPGARHER
ncbi:transmembrane protein, putative [Bodo saltans]|uniref:Transmembrane protein, putative n=1 Tax=Bodo saltans TaxID=75058 RepID=A0A0S4J2H5_BODSA|nr:transmembrane protein, putative [Bodo saltans]|eukprot:CUG43819.1 transmembrane protein, putative [Bodo saltans]